MDKEGWEKEEFPLDAITTWISEVENKREQSLGKCLLRYKDPIDHGQIKCESEAWWKGCVARADAELKIPQGYSMKGRTTDFGNT